MDKVRSLELVAILARNGTFESIPLQREVCELSVPLAVGWPDGLKSVEDPTEVRREQCFPLHRVELFDTRAGRLQRLTRTQRRAAKLTVPPPPLPCCGG